jgi:hypothetical protein
MARRYGGRKAAGVGGGAIAMVSRDIGEAVAAALRNAAKEVVNDLAAAGPYWRGGFRDSWFVETADGKRGVSVSGEDGKYNLFNIPQIKVQGRDARGRFTWTLPANTRKLELLIGNSSSYAQEAMDLIPGIFVYPGVEPLGKVHEVGHRRDRIRGDLEPPGNSRATAPLHWYTTYMEGGAFAAALKRGASSGFSSLR